MKILSIRTKNLASLEGITTIDFREEPLCSAGIFAITGPTGAGKSTLLDALCLALYAKTPRYRFAEYGIEIMDVQGSTIRQDDVRGILRDGTAEGFAEVCFAAVDGRNYQATWMVRRSRNKSTGNLQPFEMALKNITTGQNVPGKKTELLDEIERLVGLNFEQFTRSVLLAQGDFTAFLKAGKDEKSSLLEKLTGTHIYSEISKRVFEIHREQVQQLRELNAQREGIHTLTNEEVEALGLQQASIETEIKTQEKAIEEFTKEINWHEQYAILHNHLNAAQQQYEQANTLKEHALPREQRLQQIIHVQPVRPHADHLQRTQVQLTEKANHLTQLSDQLIVLTQKQEKLHGYLQQAETTLHDKVKEQEAAQPLLNTAIKLDGQLSEKAKQVQQANTELNTAREKLQQQQQKLTQTSRQKQHLEQSIQQLIKWKEDNTARQPIAEHHPLIVSKLTDAEALLAAINKRAAQITNAETAIHTNQLEKKQLDANLLSLQQSLREAQQQYDTLHATVAAIPFAALEQGKLQIDSLVEDTIAAAAHWELLYHALTERDNLQSTLENSKTQLAGNLEELSRDTNLLETVTIQRNTSLSMLEKARLAAAENVETLRAHLVADEPCPVCGSTTHPYATNNPQLDHVLSELEESHKKIEANYTRLLTTQSALQQTCDLLQATIIKQESELAAQAAPIEQLEEKWTRFNLYEACTAQPISQRTAWLQQQLQQQKAKQQDLRTKLQLYTSQKEQLDAQKSTLEERNYKLNDTINAIKDKERNLQSLQEQLANHQQEQQQSNDSLNQVQQSLAAYFSSADWFQHWKANAAVFVQRIDEFANQWKTRLQQLEESQRQQEVLATTLQGLQEQLNNAAGEVGEKERNLLQVQEQSNELLKKRKAIFNGEAVSTIDANLKAAVAQAQQAVDRYKKEKDTLQIELTRLHTKREQTEKDLAELTAQEATLQTTISTWLDEHNRQNKTALTEVALLELLTVTQEWVEEERKALLAIDDTLKQTKTVCTERSKALSAHAQHRLSERALEEITTLLTGARTLLQQHQQTANETGYKLREDANNRQRIGELLQMIEAQSQKVGDWAKLNEIIGSADGKKFRQIAQEYTLDVMLSYANVHLETLNKRYLLQRIPNSLGLQVVDQDMGDEVRTVYSLSGGESFLVSLALALGLASLSSARMKVESLFIDEGFGSLDPATLNVAMDALERLHNQGRKVGVISHVQEMTERIPVQIRVSRQHSGRSQVDIIGG